MQWLRAVIRSYLTLIVIVIVRVEVCIMHAAGTGLPGGERGGAGAAKHFDSLFHGRQGPTHAPSGPGPPQVPWGPAGLLIGLLQRVYSELLQPAIDALVGEGSHEDLAPCWQVTQLLHQVLHIPYVLYLLGHLVSSHSGRNACTQQPAILGTLYHSCRTEENTLYTVCCGM